MRNKYVIANWKMNGDCRTNGDLLEKLIPAISRMDDVGIVICPPAPYFDQISKGVAGSRIDLGAQNLSHHAKGAFTGEISASMLRDFGCRYVLVGHSERRSLYGEDDEMVASKFETALNAELIPVLCVGETFEERRALNTHQVIERQLLAVIMRVGVERLAGTIIAYEPVWAIGTGETASRAQAQEVHFRIRQFLAKHNSRVAEAISILYGGSVRPDNAAELFAQPDIDGGLIGGASLDAQSFADICRSV